MDWRPTQGVLPPRVQGSQDTLRILCEVEQTTCCYWFSEHKSKVLWLSVVQFGNPLFIYFLRNPKETTEWILL